MPTFAQGGSTLFDAIIRAEGTGKYGDPYNTSLNYVQSPTPLTSMTMDQVLQWGNSLRASQGLNSSAKGAFQITNTTQRDAMASLGLGGSDLFSINNQQLMASWIAQKQGFGAWEGFKTHPTDLATAQSASVAPLASTSGAAFSADQKRADENKIQDTMATQLRNATDAIDDQIKAIDQQISTVGKSAGEIAAATEKQKLWSAAAREGIDETTVGADRFRQFSASIDAVGNKAGAAAQKIDDFNKQQALLKSSNATRNPLGLQRRAEHIHRRAGKDAQGQQGVRGDDQKPREQHRQAWRKKA